MWYIFYFVKIHHHVSAKNEQQVSRGKCIIRKVKSMHFTGVVPEKIACLICNMEVSIPRQDILRRHNDTMHIQKFGHL
jgi:hypothetical protein